MLSAPSPYADEFRAFDEEVAREQLPQHPIVFYGSSSIRLWSSLSADFPDLPVVNRGFGGSTLAECVREFDRLVVALQPRAVVLYAGENDLSQGATPEHVLGHFQRFAANFRSRLGPVPLFVISVKPSPARVDLLPAIRRTNELLRTAISSWPHTTYIDLFSSMISEAGQPHQALFCDDWLHLSASGYRLWSTVVRGALDRILPAS